MLPWFMWFFLGRNLTGPQLRLEHVDFFRREHLLKMQVIHVHVPYQAVRLAAIGSLVESISTREAAQQGFLDASREGAFKGLRP